MRIESMQGDGNMCLVMPHMSRQLFVLTTAHSDVVAETSNLLHCDRSRTCGQLPSTCSLACFSL